MLYEIFCEFFFALLRFFNDASLTSRNVVTAVGGLAYFVRIGISVLVCLAKLSEFL